MFLKPVSKWLFFSVIIQLANRLIPLNEAESGLELARNKYFMQAIDFLVDKKDKTGNIALHDC